MRQQATGLNVYIVLAPRHPVTLDIYPQVQEMYRGLYDLIQKQDGTKVKIIDCFRAFEERDFVDLLHLNLNGAEKITKTIKETVIK
jgi:hypothetical protein